MSERMWIRCNNCGYKVEKCFFTKAEMQEALRKQRDRLFLAEEALRFLLSVKEHKDKYGKDEWYKSAQPDAWKRAEEIIEQMRGEG